MADVVIRAQGLSNRYRARTHALILKHAQRAGIDSAVAEMQHLARELFLLVRQYGAAGLGRESRDLVFLAKAATGADRATGFDFRIYEFAAGVLGWRLVGRIACETDQLRK